MMVSIIAQRTQRTQRKAREKGWDVECGEVKPPRLRASAGEDLAKIAKPVYYKNMTLSPSIHPFTHGAIQCYSLRDYRETYPLDWLLPDVPTDEINAALESLGLPRDQLDIDTNCLLLDTGRERVLIDTGWGRSLPDKQGALPDLLGEIGMTLEDITWVVLTHGDRDHCYGLLTADSEKTFPNARLLMTQDLWFFWEGVAGGSPVSPETREGFKRITRLYKDRVTFAGIDDEVIPGFMWLPAWGHRPGHTAWLVNASGESLIHVGDAVVHPLLITNSAWEWPHHAHPDQAVRDRHNLLNMAAGTGAVIYGAHFPFPGFGRVQKDGLNWSWMPLP